mgnify:CR=1 FL=1
MVNFVFQKAPKFKYFHNRKYSTHMLSDTYIPSLGDSEHIVDIG